MKITADDLSRSYRMMSDEELLVIDHDELTDIARSCLTKEMERRGITHRDPSAPPAPIEIDDDETEAWVSAGIFRFVDEAEALLPALKAAGIAAEVETNSGEVVWSGTTAYDAVRLIVPGYQSDHARHAIETYARAEDLAAREHVEAAPLTVAATYEDGVFKPHDPVDWEPGCEVDVHFLRNRD